MGTVVIIDATTGVAVERDMTHDEVAQREADAAAAATAEAEREAAARTKASKRQSALGKLKAIGLDDDEIAALLGNLDDTD